MSYHKLRKKGNKAFTPDQKSIQGLTRPAPVPDEKSLAQRKTRRISYIVKDLPLY